MKDKEKINDVEQMLINNSSVEDLIKMKIENEFKNEMEESKKIQQKRIITEISEVPQEFIFSTKAVYKLFNRNTKCETCINGVQAEGFIGIQHAVRDKISKGLLGAFATDDSYIKFEYIEL